MRVDRKRRTEWSVREIPTWNEIPIEENWMCFLGYWAVFLPLSRFAEANRLPVAAALVSKDECTEWGLRNKRPAIHHFLKNSSAKRAIGVYNECLQ
mmetsp:Transcript_13651/g.34325  ORF Transcript_13651/g.34325 Transcript_13651/m.34325 type:complete len:96 (+) Transcript_13651:2129-2416(+)